MALCRECALSVGMRAQVEAFQRLSQLLLQQEGSLNEVSEEMRAAMQTKCARCGMIFEEFVQTGLLGCPQCYHDFHELLKPMLRRMHGVTRQSAELEDDKPSMPLQASAPVSQPVPAESRAQLEIELNLALLDEDYERAAALRDKLKGL
jgi:protein arginine kinase activator